MSGPKVVVEKLDNSHVSVFKVILYLDKGFLMLGDLFDIIFTKARDLKAIPSRIIPQDRMLIIYFKRRETP